MAKFREVTEVTVIGGGVVGLSTAYHLAKEGVDVILVERNELASGATGSNSAMCGESSAPEPAGRWHKIFENLGTELRYNIEYIESPVIFVYTPENIKEMKKIGIWEDFSSKMVIGEKIKEIEPRLAEDIIGVSQTSGHFVNPFKLCYGFAQATKRLGGKIHLHTNVKEIKVSNGVVRTVVTDKGEIKTDFVVNAAGAWSSLIGNMVGIDIPVVPLKGHILVTEPAQKTDPFHLQIINEFMYNIYPYNQRPEAVNSNDPRIRLGIAAYITYDPVTNNYILGGSHEFNGYDRQVNPDTVRHIAKHCIRIIPQLRKINIIRIFTGFRPYCYVDGESIFSKVEGIEGFIIATGTGGEGLILGPMGGKLISELIIRDKTSLPIDAYSFSRFKN